MTEQPPGTDRPAGQRSLGGGRYVLLGLLGRGGMAEVFRGSDTRLGRHVAIKQLRVDLAGDPTFQARFRREAQSAASLDHPAIASVYDTGDEPDPQGSGLLLPYIVMELIDGLTLRDTLRDGRKILPERALEIMASVLDALDFSHRAGIIHRDIKPANVMLTPTGAVKVMDFGIARAIADSSATMTQTAAVVGTAQYLSPEQARGDQVDARSDLYSAGCVLYELLTGRPPFVGESPVSVAYQHVREEPTPPSKFNPELSPEVDAIVMKSLRKRVEDRYQSAAEMRADIQRALAGVPVRAPGVVSMAGLPTEAFLPPVPLAESQQTAISQPVGDDYDEAPRRRNRWLALFAVIVAALVVAALLIVPRFFTSAPTPQVSVPALANLTLAQAESQLKQAGLKVGTVKRVHSTVVKKGHVIRQGTPPHTFVDKGSAVNLEVSAGSRTAVVPDVTRGNLAAATAALEQLGFTVKPIPDRHSRERQNQVVRTVPSAGAPETYGSQVKVYYSTGYVVVPSVVGASQQEATSTLKSAGFHVVPSMTQSDAAKGTVVRQDPPGNSKQPYGSYVTIFVSLGPPPLPPCGPTTSSTPQVGQGDATTPTPTGSTTSTTPPPTTPPPTTTPPTTPSSPTCSPTA
ncbi:MAG TPA: Stk1 family PASTA domain-containing Ser/Thr kinase [Nocardioidaceae bacterium]|nr:Stk1 family PASTA domain-containing Ser/Thr kinase [Nocardioidaceae bacterium]